MKFRHLLFFIVIFLFSSATLAQQACGALVTNAINIASQSCSGLGLNQVCYGNVILVAAPAPGVGNLVFNRQGDRISVGDISSIRLASQLDSTGEWGIALMQLQAETGGTIPGQAVTVVMFGQAGLDRADAPGFGPMQAFTMVPGPVQPLCNGAPPNGILIQTPRGTGQVTLRINGIDVSLGSSAFIQSDENTSSLSIALLDGSGTISVGGVRQVLTPGTLSSVPIAADGRAVGTPSVPAVFDPTWFAGIPVSLLPEPVSLPGAATPPAGNPGTGGSGGSVDNNAGQIAMVNGTYDVAWDECGRSGSYTSELIFTGTQIILSGITFDLIAPNTYANYTGGVERLLVVESPTRATETYPYSDGTCLHYHILALRQ